MELLSVATGAAFSYFYFHEKGFEQGVGMVALLPGEQLSGRDAVAATAAGTIHPRSAGGEGGQRAALEGPMFGNYTGAKRLRNTVMLAISNQVSWDQGVNS